MQDNGLIYKNPATIDTVTASSPCNGTHTTSAERETRDTGETRDTLNENAVQIELVEDNTGCSEIEDMITRVSNYYIN